MKVKKILKDLRKKAGLSQEALAQKVLVTRQAVSRWETGETVPNTETLKLLSALFGVTINTLLGQPRELYCQACGMPLRDDESVARDTEGGFNEEFCRWCWVDGAYAGPGTMEEMIEVCVPHMGMPPDQARALLQKQLPQLKFWKAKAEAEAT